MESGAPTSLYMCVSERKAYFSRRDGIWNTDGYGYGVHDLL